MKIIDDSDYKAFQDIAKKHSESGILARAIMELDSVLVEVQERLTQIEKNKETKDNDRH